MKPSIGRVLVFTQQEHETPHSGHRDHPCIITHVWTDDCVNVKVFFDCGPVEDRTSQQFSTGMVKWPERV